VITTLGGFWLALPFPRPQFPLQLPINTLLGTRLVASGESQQVLCPLTPVGTLASEYGATITSRPDAASPISFAAGQTAAYGNRCIAADFGLTTANKPTLPVRSTGGYRDVFDRRTSSPACGDLDHGAHRGGLSWRNGCAAGVTGAAKSGNQNGRVGSVLTFVFPFRRLAGFVPPLLK